MPSGITIDFSFKIRAIWKSGNTSLVSKQESVNQDLNVDNVIVKLKKRCWWVGWCYSGSRIEFEGGSTFLNFALVYSVLLKIWILLNSHFYWYCIFWKNTASWSKIEERGPYLEFISTARSTSPYQKAPFQSFVLVLVIFNLCIFLSTSSIFV